MTGIMNSSKQDTVSVCGSSERAHWGLASEEASTLPCGQEEARDCGNTWKRSLFQELGGGLCLGKLPGQSVV